MAVPATKLSLTEYLDWENQQPDRNEFYRGEVFAMVGARRVHGRVVLNLAHRLMGQLGGSPCQVFTESMKLQVADDAIFYPDLMVTCDAADLASDLVFRAPSLVIEVLSPSTQAYDRGLKFATYRRLPSLKEFILVDPDARRVEGYRRTEQDQWLFFDMSEGPTLDAPSIGCRVPLAEVFDGLDPPPSS
jgi:Uma2 family endonuclease